MPPSLSSPLVDDPASDAETLDAILDGIENLADVDDVVRAFERELRALDLGRDPHRGASPDPSGTATVDGLDASVLDLRDGTDADALAVVRAPSLEVAAEVAHVEQRFEAEFDVAVMDDGRDDARDATAAALRSLPDEGDVHIDPTVIDPTVIDPTVIDPTTGDLVAHDAAEHDDPVSYELLAGAVAADEPSPRAAAAKRAGRRRLVLLMAIVSGIVAFAGIAVRSAQQAAAADAAELVVATTSIAPRVAAPPPTTEPVTTEPPTTATTEPTSVATTAPTTVAPTTASTAPPTTRTPTTSTPPTTATTTTWRTSTTYAAPAAAGSYGFLDCVRARESRGDYTAMNPSGAHGAYQLMPVTARETALRAGRTDLASTPVVNWSRADQDAMAAQLYQWQGAAPWGGGCAYPSN